MDIGTVYSLFDYPMVVIFFLKNTKRKIEHKYNVIEAGVSGVRVIIFQNLFSNVIYKYISVYNICRHNQKFKTRTTWLTNNAKII